MSTPQTVLVCEEPSLNLSLWLGDEANLSLRRTHHPYGTRNPGNAYPEPVEGLVLSLSKGLSHSMA